MKPLTSKKIYENWATLLLATGRSGNADWNAKVRKNSKGLSVFIPGHRLTTGIKWDALGVYSNIVYRKPFAAQKWHNLIRKDLKAGQEQESRISVFMRKFIAPLITAHDFPNHACDWFMAILGGWADVGEKLRWLYRLVPKEYIAEIKPKTMKTISDFF